MGLASGFCSAFLGIGAGLFIVSFLPIIVNFSALETLQTSLLVVFCINTLNAILFSIQKMVLWKQAIPIMSVGFITSFLLSLYVTSLSSFQIRLHLWICLALLPLIIFVIKKTALEKKALNGLVGFLVGTCSGLTGLGGGLILSPLLYESKKISVQKIPPLVSVSTVFISFSALLGQEKELGFFSNNLNWWTCTTFLIFSSTVGLLLGQHFNKKKKASKLRRCLVQSLLFSLFILVTLELFQNHF